MLASTVGISNPHMSNIERGKTKVSLATLIDIGKGKLFLMKKFHRNWKNAVKKTSELFMIW